VKTKFYDGNQETFERLQLPTSTTTTTARPYYIKTPPVQQWLTFPPKVIPVFENPEQWKQPPKQIDRFYLPPLMGPVQPAFPGRTENYFETFPFLSVDAWPRVPPRNPTTQRAINDPTIKTDFTFTTTTTTTTAATTTTSSSTTPYMTNDEENTPGYATPLYANDVATSSSNDVYTPPSNDDDTTISNDVDTPPSNNVDTSSSNDVDTSPPNDVYTSSSNNVETSSSNDVDTLSSTTEEDIFVPIEYGIDLRNAEYY
jgi:hypothetical protein